MKGKSKSYIEGFKHGTEWARIFCKCMREMDKADGSNREDDLIEFRNSVKEAIKSLKAGR